VAQFRNSCVSILINNQLRSLGLVVFTTGYLFSRSLSPWNLFHLPLIEPIMKAALTATSFHRHIKLLPQTAAQSRALTVTPPLPHFHLSSLAALLMLPLQLTKEQALKAAWMLPSPLPSSSRQCLACRLLATWLELKPVKQHPSPPTQLSLVVRLWLASGSRICLLQFLPSQSSSRQILAQALL